MNRRQIIVLVLACAALSLVLNVFFGRWVAATVSTWPVLNRLKILSPQAPLVINRREEIRVSESPDFTQSAQNVRPKLSLLLARNGGQLEVLGGAINLTADGYLVTISSSLSGRGPESLLVKLDGGAVGAVSSVMLDEPSGLAFVKADLSGLPIAELGESGSLLPGQRLALLWPDLGEFSWNFKAAFVSRRQYPDFRHRDADVPSRAFQIDFIPGLPGGLAAVDASGAVVGLVSPSGVVSSDLIKATSALFLGNGGKISRPVFGFKYRLLGLAESAVLGVPAGAEVIEAEAGSAARRAGLAAGDIIVSWAGAQIGERADLEQQLQKVKPGETVKVKAYRAGSVIDLTLIAGEEK